MMLAKAKGSIIVILVAIVLAFGVNMFVGSQTDALDAALFAQQDEIDVLNTKIAVAKANLEGNEQHAVQQVTGIDMTRKAADDEVFRGFAETVFTWSGVEGYGQMRQKVITDYNISASSMFMMNFLPSRPYSSEQAESVTSQLESMNTICYSMNEESGVYDYMAEVVCQTAGELGGVASVLSIFTYSVDTDGNILNVMAYDV